jgi:hypothetical protein
MTFVPITQDQLDDSIGIRWSFEAQLHRAAIGVEPRTQRERITGWREFTSSSGLSGDYAVGWRAEQMAREADAQREAEMAACPYHVCTCGHHEE